MTDIPTITIDGETFYFIEHWSADMPLYNKHDMIKHYEQLGDAGFCTKPYVDEKLNLISEKKIPITAIITLPVWYIRGKRRKKIPGYLFRNPDDVVLFRLRFA